MLTNEVVAKLTAISTAAALNPALWQDYLKGVTEVVGDMCAQILKFGPDGQPLGQASYGYAPEFLETYTEYYASRNVWAPGFLRHSAGAVVDSQEMCPDSELVRTEWYNDWVKPQNDIALGGGGVIAKGLDGAFMIGGNIPRRAGEEAVKTWLTLVGLLLPQLRVVWDLSRTLTSERLGGSDPGLFVVRQDRRLAFLNEAAQDVLTKGGVLRIDGVGRLLGSNHAITRWLDSSLSALRSGFVGRRAFQHALTKEKTATLQATVVNPDLVGECWPLPSDGHSGPCLLVVCSEDTPGVSQAAGLETRWGMTPAEAAVTVALASGRAPRRIAENRQVSVHTVRNQIKSAMSKTGVRRQTELVVLARREWRT